MSDGCFPVLGAVVQIAYVVDDLALAAARHAAIFGSGPFLDFGVIPLLAHYRGQQVTFEAGSAYGQWGDIQVELLQPFNDEASFLSPAPMPPGTSQCHHMTVFKDDPAEFTAALAAHDVETVMTMRSVEHGMEARFADTREMLGHYLEVYAPVAPLLNLYDAVRSARKTIEGDTAYHKVAMPA